MHIRRQLLAGNETLLFVSVCLLCVVHLIARMLTTLLYSAHTHTIFFSTLCRRQLVACVLFHSISSYKIYYFIAIFTFRKHKCHREISSHFCLKRFTSPLSSSFTAPLPSLHLFLHSPPLSATLPYWSHPQCLPFHRLSRSNYLLKE